MKDNEDEEEEEEEEYLNYGLENLELLFEFLSNFENESHVKLKMLIILEKQTSLLRIEEAMLIPEDSMNILFHYIAFPETINIVSNILKVSPKNIIIWINCFGTIQDFVDKMLELFQINKYTLPILRFIECSICILETQNEILKIIQKIINLIPNNSDIKENIFDLFIYISKLKIEQFYMLIIDNITTIFNDCIFNDTLFDKSIYFYYKFTENYDFNEKAILLNNNLIKLFQYSILENHQESVRYLCNLLFNCCINSPDLLEYVLKNNIIFLFMNSKEKLSFIVWSEFVDFICLMINDNTDLIINYLLEHNVINELIEMTYCRDNTESIITSLKIVLNYLQMHSNEYKYIIEQIMNLEINN